MKKRFIISESEKNTILSMYKLIKEDSKTFTYNVGDYFKVNSSSSDMAYEITKKDETKDKYIVNKYTKESDGKIEKIQQELFRDSFDELVTDEVLIKMKDKTEFDDWYNNKTINNKKVVSTSNDVKIGDIYKNAKGYDQHYKILSLDDTTKDYKVNFSGYDGGGNFDTTEIQLSPAWFEKNLKDNKIIKITEEEYNIFIEKHKDDSVGCGYDKTKGSILGDVTEIPRNGIAKFEGTINGKEVSINGCFNKGKVILTYDEGETGSRGNFKGHYYTKDITEPFLFSGDSTFSNNFLAGTLDNDNETDIEEYRDNFHTRTWTYSGYFTKEGKIGESNPEILIPDSESFKINKTPTILFALGDYYYGEFKDTKIDGKGVYYFADNGLKLQGEFKTIEEEGGVSYSCKLSTGEEIPNIFEYKEKYDLEKNKKKEDKSFGVLKKGTLKGSTLFKTTITNTETKEKKELNGKLPFVNIKVQNKTYKDIVLEIKSDENGNFEFSNLPFGNYRIVAAYDKGDGIGYVMPKQNIVTSIINNNNEVVFDSEGKKINLTLVPTKNTKIRDNIEATENPEFFKNVNSKNYVEQRLNLEYSKYEYEKYLKNTKKEIEDYTDKQTLQFCKKETTLYAKMVRDLYNGLISKEMVKSPQNLQPTKDFLKSCYMRYKNDSKFFNYKKNEDLVLLMNPGNDLYRFKVVLEHKDIYIKNTDMSITNSIRKVIKEHSQVKNDSLIENQIIKNRINFIVKNSNNRNIKKNLIEESKKLIDTGYNENFVKSLLKKLLN